MGRPCRGILAGFQPLIDSAFGIAGGQATPVVGKMGEGRFEKSFEVPSPPGLPVSQWLSLDIPGLDKDRGAGERRKAWFFARVRVRRTNRGQTGHWEIIVPVGSRSRSRDTGPGSHGRRQRPAELVRNSVLALKREVGTSNGTGQ